MYHHFCLLISLSCIAMFALGIVYREQKVYLIPVSILVYLLYPLVLEPLYAAISKICGKSINKNILNENSNKKHYFTNKLPIVYSKQYNITAFGIEKMHPFDASKYEKIYNTLIESAVISKDQLYTPNMPSRNIISNSHSFLHMLKLNYSLFISYMIEIPLCFLPSEFLRYRLLNSMLLATQGSLDAACLSLAYGWSINLSGGYHHASKHKGEGFCVYADISMIVYYMRIWFSNVKNIMIVDLDAHQGNGYEKDLIKDENIYILDAYNNSIYPNDNYAKRAISSNVYVSSLDDDESYIRKIKNAMNESLVQINDDDKTDKQKFKPDLLIYNAGTDCMENDPLGHLNITEEGILKRDELMFDICLKNNIPIVMLMSGGYQKTNGYTIGRSILNLIRKFDLSSSTFKDINL